MTRLNKIKSFFCGLLLFIVPRICFAEIINFNQYDFMVDIPEGYNLVDATKDGKSFMFTHPNIPVTFVVKVYEDEGYMYTQEALESALKKLSASYDVTSFAWNNKECSVSNFNMILDKEYSGWSVAAPTDNNTYLVMLCYAPTNDADKCQEFIFSTLNSLCIDDYYLNSPGIITTFAFPDQGNLEINANIAGNEIKANFDLCDKEGSQFIVDMEYKVLSFYAQHNLWKEAWQRYYRMIFRDSYGRLEDFSKNAYNILYPLAENERPENPDIQYAQYLLSWVQTFDYKRAESKSKSDFTSLPSILLGEGSDCDSRSLLICTMLEYIGIDSLLLISPEYSHALVATNINAPGQTYYSKENNTNYIMGETTANVTWGMIAEDQADRNKWFAVSLPLGCIEKN